MRRTMIVWLSVLIHVVACLGLLLVQGGTEAEPEMAKRAKWIAEQTPLWTTVWVFWALASTSLWAVFVVWASRLCEQGAPRTVVLGGCLLCGVGVLFDLSGEIVNIVGLTQPGLSLSEFAERAWLFTLLSPGIANGIYCVAGLALSAVSWRTGLLRDWLGLLGLCMWVDGVLLTMVAFLNNRVGMVVTGAGVMVLFIPWAALTGWRLR